MGGEEVMVLLFLIRFYAVKEAEYYFNRIKGVEQVIDAISNRVNLYMSGNSI